MGAATLVTLLLCTGYQFFAYSRPAEYLLDYTFPGILICAAFLFAWLRRVAHRVPLKGAVTYLARISFGIYFVHIIIMELLEWQVVFTCRPWMKMALLELISFAGSILVIWPLSRIPFGKKCLFLIKD